ncbi:MAG: hypothetical protein ABWX61_06230 [Paenisporosarcina sp.]
MIVATVAYYLIMRNVGALNIKTLFELIRLIIIFVFFGALSTVILINTYTRLEVTGAYMWLSAIAIVLMLFVFYKNKWQFTGWNREKNKGERIPQNVSFTLTLVSIILILSTFILDSLLS